MNALDNTTDRLDGTSASGGVATGGTAAGGAASGDRSDAARTVAVRDEAWQDLVSSALVGTDRRTPPDYAPFAAPGDNPAAALLSSAALMSAWRRAGSAGSAYSAEFLDEAKPSAEDPRPVLSPQNSARLAALVASRSENLPEWLAAAAKSGHRAPSELLPPLFEYARGSVAVRADLMTLAGPRGTWLAKQNHQWSNFTRFSADPDPDAWDSSKPAERVGYLTWLRGTDPAKARDLVIESWARQGQTAETRASFVEAFAHGLGPGDEEFLESALDDKSSKVRAEAGRLLAILPGSAFSGRMAERLHALVRIVDGGDGLSIAPLAAAGTDAPDAVRDGLGQGWMWTEEYRRLSVDRLASFYEDLIGSAPLPAWDFYGYRPSELLRCVSGGKWEAEAAQRGWRWATLRQRNADWAEALSEVNASSDVLELLTDEAAERWALRMIADHRSQYSIHNAPVVLSRLRRQWSTTTCDMLLDAIPAYLPNARRNEYARFFGMENLAGRWMPASCADAVAAKADEIRAEHQWWAEDLDELVTLLRERTVMLAELGDD
jgi:hypothetical protein